MKLVERDIGIILHNIRSAHNVGAIFRTADAVGVSKIFLTGYTPAPVDRFGRKRGSIAKTALGAEETVLYQQHEDIAGLLLKLQVDGYRIIAVEQNSSARFYKKENIQPPCVFIFGNEVLGIEQEVLSKADTIIEIPMCGNKESLNVAVVAGIILFHFFG